MAEVTDEDEARMVMLYGLGYSGSEIADELGFAQSTIYDYLNEHEDGAKAADDWEAYYWEVVTGAVYGEEFRNTVSGLLADLE